MATAAPEIPAVARDQAFESLYRQYAKDVYHYALALLRNSADAEDVTQTTFLNAYRAYIKGVEVEKPQNWLIKIAHNVARTRYARASRRVKEVPLEEHVELIAVPEGDRPDVQAVLDALGRLPFNQRSALVMRELEGRTYAEIADTIGVSVSAVETLIFRARRSLRLKASELRSLAVVPLPTSLAQFFDTGGVVAGGGAVAGAGGGLLLKAAAAIVAGALATGIGSDRSGPASAAPSSTHRIAAPSWQVAASLPTPGIRAVNASRGARVPGAKSARPEARGIGIGSQRAGEPGLGPQAHDQTVAQAPAGSASTATTQSGPLGQVSQVTDQAASLVGEAQKALESPAAALPVEVPPLPLVPPVPVPPVEAPKLPGGTPLP
jgi:RNA polymerase sigma factor (sigma-70 family)